MKRVVRPGVQPRLREAFREREVTATLQCAGNRRAGLVAIRDIPAGDRPAARSGKPFFHGGIAAALADLDTPFVFAIDANEPRSEALDSVTFHWRDGRPGAKQFASLLGLKPVHRGRDLLREHLRATGRPPAGDTYLALTYTTHGGGSSGRRRSDSMWATPEFRLCSFSTDYEGALAAGTDHAMLVAHIELWPSPDRRRGTAHSLASTDEDQV